ncbi:hypothetical protein SNE25_15140 [Mucilaginibacter sabulilitoris]|uniref:Uncharacterized protein n=1 Tax=Mucilaginibacter sabulilitoris TaxID=1173583 RepID=A0ABZ0TUU9_9SPHI|nr:hypothetical protein [Mucilaginibacter sabulilitoris]WPU96856.1 hypothetical protein SNE25_15140 [Mucilaginibacter sabulilitoris]
MFNLPFPTDSLYKFAFMFGLALIVFAFYFRDTHLNRYNKTQPIFSIDSISEVDEVQKKAFVKVLKYIDSTELKNFTNSGLMDENDFLIIADELNHKKVIDTLSKIEDIDMYFHGLLKRIKSPDYVISKQGVASSFYIRELLYIRMDAIDKKHKKEIAYYNDVKKDDNSSFQFLLTSGIVLFILGSLGWYFNIQRIQDKLLKFQLSETEIKIVESKVIKTRKHFEPKMLPRPEVRNGV